MNLCRDCNSEYATPGTCNCFAPGGKRAPRTGPPESGDEKFARELVERAGQQLQPTRPVFPVFVPSLRERGVGDPTFGCPCLPENGGSGICGCYRPSVTFTA